MVLTNIQKRSRPILIVGKPGTGKTEKALSLLSDNPIIQYANEYDLEDNFSLPRSRGLLIEEVHYKAKTDLIVQTLLEYKGQIVLTSLNQKDVPKKLFDMCKLTRSGKSSKSKQRLLDLAPRANQPKQYELDVFSIMMEYMKNPNREEVLQMLKINQPSDVQLLSWLAENVHPNKLRFIDSDVKRKWPKEYFYELLAYSHEGRVHRRIKMPKRRQRNDMRIICRKLGLNPKEYYTLPFLLKDNQFKENAKKRLNHKECRFLKLGEKKRRKKTDPIMPVVSLDRWF